MYVEKTANGESSVGAANDLITPLLKGGKTALYKPPGNKEPEVSFCPDPDKCDAGYLLEQFPSHMGEVLEPTQHQINFREFCMTLTLGSKNGATDALGNYNVRMRFMIHPMPNGTVLFSNIQLTAKSKGNGRDRLELETDDNLPSMSIPDAYAALEEKYPGRIPQEIQQLDLDDLVVDAVALNSRVGRNGGYHFEDPETGKQLRSIVMINSDTVLFAPPQILDARGELINLGYRPEAEIEINYLEAKTESVRQFLQQASEERMSGFFADALKDVEAHASKLFPAVKAYTTGKVDEAQERVRDWEMVSGFNTAGHQTYMRTEDYAGPDMQAALHAMVKALPSPHEHHDLEYSRRAGVFDHAVRSGRRMSHAEGYTWNLPNFGMNAV